jgi:sugar/nucleoside kinase (ribokinase family)
MTCDIATVGNAVIDILLSVTPNESFSRLDADKKALSIEIGRKIPADSASVTAGGGAVRVATSLSRFSYTTALYASVGEDEFAEKILKILKGEHVDTTHVVAEGPETSCTMGLSYEGERTLFTHHTTFPNIFDFTDLQTKWIYLAALGREWEGAYGAVFGYLEEHPDVKLAFNPGHTQLVGGFETIKPLLARTETLFVNREEACCIVEKEVADMPELLRLVKAAGPKTVVITDGKNGSYLIDTDDSIYSHAILPAEIVEKTGAGDAFASGFLAGHLEGKRNTEAMQWGTANSAAVIGKMGGNEGLLTREGLRAMLEREDMPDVEKLSS